MHFHLCFLGSFSTECQQANHFISCFLTGGSCTTVIEGQRGRETFLNTVVCRFVSVIRVESSRPIGVMLTYLDCLSELSDHGRRVQTGSCFTFSCGQKFREMQLTDERGYVRSQNMLPPL